MKSHIIHRSLLCTCPLAAVVSVAQADLTLPAFPAPQQPEQVVQPPAQPQVPGQAMPAAPSAAPAVAPEAPATQAAPPLHSELLASNAVHAIYRGIRTVPKVTLDGSASLEEIGVFEVKQNLAHRRYDRMGDGPLQEGKLLGVALATDVPGQDASLAQQIRAMAPGDEALMNIDHVYVFRQDGNETVHPCTRFVPVPGKSSETQPVGTPPAQPEGTAVPEPDAIIPNIPSLPPVRFTTGTHKSTRVTVRSIIEPDGRGGMRQTRIEERCERDESTGQETVRKFINGVEVDPQTDQPLSPR